MQKNNSSIQFINWFIIDWWEVQKHRTLRFKVFFCYHVEYFWAEHSNDAFELSIENILYFSCLQARSETLIITIIWLHFLSSLLCTVLSSSFVLLLLFNIVGIVYGRPSHPLFMKNTYRKTFPTEHFLSALSIWQSSHYFHQMLRCKTDTATHGTL